jgi:hypothetical protein
MKATCEGHDMAKLPYGGIDLSSPLNPEDNLRTETVLAWLKLRAIQRAMQNNQPIHPALQHWLGNAIEYSNKDAGKLLRGLGLRRTKGAPSEFSDSERMEWAQRVLDKRNEGLPIEQSIREVQDEISNTGKSEPDRATLRRWAKELEDCLEEIRRETED